ncbi:hypothetical protein B0O99DRAFT_252485 [Bisporella sp. PMI_857]|nr:hypothetical protein B0O99DRAFT_252485 [Bisporella sp. PMI_857]
MAQRSAQRPEHGQSMMGHVQQIYAVPNFQALNTQRNHEQQARPPTHMGYDSSLVDQRHHINQTNGLTANFRSENNQQSDKRSRGFSNDYSNGYYSQRNNFQEQKLSDRHNNYRNQNERQYNNSSYSHSGRSKFERRNITSLCT